MFTPLKKVTLAVAFTTLVGAMPFSLQAQTMPMRGPIPFATYDQNGDGVITENEFDAVRAERMQQRAEAGMPMRNVANAPDFATFDANHDGKLTPAELQAGQAARMQQRGGGKGMMGPGPR